MAETGTRGTEKHAKAAQAAGDAKSRKRQAEGAGKRKQVSPRVVAAAVIIILVVAIAAVLFVLVPNVSGVSFQAFKLNFNAAPRVALAVTFHNQTQYEDTVPCYTTMLEIIGRTRNASSIDFYLLNSTTCTYLSQGLGSARGAVKTSNASSCLSTAYSEPSIFLNYSSNNYTRITPDHIYISADSAYLASCPIAAEFG